MDNYYIVLVHRILNEILKLCLHDKLVFDAKLHSSRYINYYLEIVYIYLLLIFCKIVLHIV